MGRWRRVLELGAFWLALLVAFSPVLADLARNLAEFPEDRVTLLAPLLLILALVGRGSEPTPSHRDGAGLIAVGVAMELLGILGASSSFGRFGLALAVVGLARFRGAPPTIVAALVFFAIPVPDSLVATFEPELEAALARMASSLLAAIGVSVEANGVTLNARAGRIDLLPADGGAALAMACGALAWYSVAREGDSLWRAALRTGLAVVMAVPLQILVLSGTGWLLALGRAEAAGSWLRYGGWLGVGLLGLAWIHRRPRPRPGVPASEGGEA